MSLFDFLMPEVAQASHLRKIARSSELANTQQRLQQSRNTQTEYTGNQRIKELEFEVGELTILLEALIERLEERDSMTRAELAQKISEIDARDGVIDGKITKSDTSSERGKVRLPKKPKFKAKLHIPES